MKTYKNGFDVLNVIIMALMVFLTVYPIYYVLIGSLNEGGDYGAGGVWLLPRAFTFSNYIVVFGDSQLWVAYRNTILRVVLGTALSLGFTSLVAYAMSQKELPCKKFFRGANLFTMFFGGGLVPFFMLMCLLGFYDSFFIYIIPSMYSVYNMIILSSFFKSISYSMREAAIMDGAGELTIYWKVYMPLSKAALATVGLWVATGYWNNYFDTMLYTRSPNLITLQYYLLRLIRSASSVDSGVGIEIIEKTTSQTITFAAIIVASLPIMCVYPFLQKYFVKGIMIGSLKG